MQMGIKMSMKYERVDGLGKDCKWQIMIAERERCYFIIHMICDLKE